ncbi:MAG: hypothetical protein IJ849_09600 [Selenomonadaceae bacterium]|nr:hypothetical protein [Selenomonadaceae bacterium]
MKLDDLDEALEKAQRLRALLTDTPALVAFAEAMHSAREPLLILEEDRLVRAGEAAKILGVNANTIGMWVKDGRLTPWYTPGNSQRKFKLSEVWAIPRQCVPGKSN